MGSMTQSWAAVIPAGTPTVFYNMNPQKPNRYTCSFHY